MKESSMIVYALYALGLLVAFTHQPGYTAYVAGGLVIVGVRAVLKEFHDGK